MKRDEPELSQPPPAPDAGLAPAAPPAPQVALLLAHIEQSRAFKGSPRHRALLRHLVERSLAGELAGLKESVIAVEVFSRSASGFDARTDSIVRVETRRLRARLATYFGSEGRAGSLRIELPVGSYVPRVAPIATLAFAPEATRRARDLVERGEHFLRQALSQTGLEQALDRFDAALRESPDHVPALVGAGRAWLNLALGWYREPQAAAEHALEALRRALALDDGNAQAHALLGAAVHSFERDWSAARRSFNRAIERAPDLAFAHSAYGRHLLFNGDLDAAERHLMTARRLDPQYINTRMHMIDLRMVQGRLADAQAEIAGMADIAPRSMPLAGAAGLLALVRGDPQAAIAHYRRACEIAPGHPGAGASLAAALGAAGRIDEADEQMAQWPAEPGEPGAPGPDPLSPYVRAVVAARCGRPEAAFAHLRRALVLRDPSAVMLPIELSFDGLHADPRWPPLLAAVRKPARH